MATGYVTIRNCNWLHEAEFVKSVLAADGIDAEIPDEHFASIQSLQVGAIGGIRVLVREEDAERAAAVLNAVLEVPPS